MMATRGLRERIVDIAHRHRRYSYRMIRLRLRHEGEVWSIDFVFDRLADGYSLKCFTHG
jgi:hypothetical protein